MVVGVVAAVAVVPDVVLWLNVSGHASRVGFPSHVLGVGQLVVLLVLHPTVLEPDFDLAL